MKVDRTVQRRILELCADQYPISADPDPLIAELGADGEDIYVSNVAYLDEHGLLDASLQIGADGSATWGRPTISARGMDFLADDGGLSAILGAVVVKLHADTIRDMLLVKAEALSLPANEKSALRKQIEALPAQALQAATSRLAQEGLAHVPDVLHWLRMTLGL